MKRERESWEKAVNLTSFRKPTVHNIHGPTWDKRLYNCKYPTRDEEFV